MSSKQILDKILDGEPVLVLFTPELKKQLRRRMIERAAEERREASRPDDRLTAMDMLDNDISDKLRRTSISDAEYGKPSWWDQ